MCYHQQTGLPRAVKVISKDMAQFPQEMRILKTMDHPNIVRLYETYSDESCYYMVTEYASRVNVDCARAANYSTESWVKSPSQKETLHR